MPGVCSPEELGHSDPSVLGARIEMKAKLQHSQDPAVKKCMQGYRLLAVISVLTLLGALAAFAALEALAEPLLASY